MDGELRTLAQSRESRLSVAAAALLWATTGLAGTLAPPAASTAALAEARTLIGGLALAAIVLVRSGVRPFSAALGWPLVLASAALAVFQWSFFAAVRGAGSALAAVLSAGLSPFAGDAIAAVRARGYDGARVLFVGAFGAVVVAEFVASGELTEDSGMVAGVLSAAVSGVAYAVYAELVSQLSVTSSPGPAPPTDASLALTALALLGAAVVLAPLASNGITGLASMRGAAVTAYLGIVATALPYAAFVYGLRALATGDALAILILQPIAAAAIGWFVLSERIELPVALGMFALLLAAALRSWRQSTAAHSTELTRTREEIS
jgi:DME family drug/metabolite transporter